MTLSTRLYRLVLLLALLPLFAGAQDPHFSQYYAAPWALNPALTGVFDGSWRAQVNYRDQWGTVLSPNPFRTTAAAFEYRTNVLKDDYVSFGLGAMHDEAGAARFSQNRVQLGAAYLKQLSGGPRKTDQYLSAGIQLGMGQHSIDWSQIWFSRQFDPVTSRPDYTASNGENTVNASSNPYLDFNAGLLWYLVFNNDGYFYLGAGAHHLNAPVISMLDNNQETLYQRYTLHAGGLFPVSHHLALVPGMLVLQQGPAFQSNLGMNVRYTNHDRNEIAIRAGLWTRIVHRYADEVAGGLSNIQADAVTVTGMLEIERWMVGLSYDITTSSLSRANNSRGAFELSLIYYHPGSKRSRVVCPRF
jgi:type IX secretion system PorP/SprF family membrane protein